MPRIGARAAAVISLIGLAPAAQAESLTFKLEGGAGIVNFADTGIYLLERGAPPTDVFFSVLQRGMHRGPLSFYARGEADLDLDLPSGRTLRLSGIWADLQGTHHEETPVYFWVETAVRYSPEGDQTAIHGCIGACPLVDGQSQPCATFFGSIDRSNHEMMPQLSLGQASGKSTTWIGVQGFSGRLDETTSGRVESRFPRSMTLLTEVGGDATGLLLTFQHERALPSGARLTLGLGLGGYDMPATGLS